MTEKTLSILGVIKKKLDSLDRGSKNKASVEDLNNEFDYVVPAKKSSEIKNEENKDNQQQVSKNSQESKIDGIFNENSNTDSKQPLVKLPTQSADNSEVKFDFNLNFKQILAVTHYHNSFFHPVCLILCFSKLIFLFFPFGYFHMPHLHDTQVLLPHFLVFCAAVPHYSI